MTEQLVQETPGLASSTPAEERQALFSPDEMLEEGPLSENLVCVLNAFGGGTVFKIV